MNDLYDLQSSLNSESPEVLVQCPTIIAKVLYSLTSDTITQFVIPAIKRLLTSNFDEVSDAMLQALPYICKSIQKIVENSSDAANYIIENIFPIFGALPDDVNEDTIALAADAISAIIEPLSGSISFATNGFVDFLNSLANSHKKTLREIAALTLEYSAEIVDINDKFDLISEIIIQFATDSSNSIRGHVPSIITAHIDLIHDPFNVSQFSAQMILLAHDKAPSVRKAVVECLFDFAQKVDKNEKILIVQPVLLQLLDDSIPQIRMLALARFAPILNTIGACSSEEVIKKYCHFLLSEDENTAYSVAFAFSAVALGIGANRFNKELLPTFNRALQSFDPRVRRTLAYSLTTFAQLFTPSDLCEAVCTLLKDMPFVSIGVVSNLSAILPYVDDRESLLFCLLNPSAKYSEWRMRLKVSDQLRKCIKFFEREDLLESAAELVEDDVALVRKDASISFAELMEKGDVDKLKELAENENHWVRLCAAQICGFLKWENDEVKKILKKLRKDKVYAVKNEAQKVTNRYGFF